MSGRYLCPYCIGTDVQHQIGEPCYWEQMEEEQRLREDDQRRWNEYGDAYYRDHPHG